MKIESSPFLGLHNRDNDWAMCGIELFQIHIFKCNSKEKEYSTGRSISYNCHIIVRLVVTALPQCSLVVDKYLKS